MGLDAGMADIQQSQGMRPVIGYADAIMLYLFKETSVGNYLKM